MKQHLVSDKYFKVAVYHSQPTLYIYIYVGCMCYLSEVDTAMIDDSLEMYFLATRSDVDEGGG